jgi:hypothetical protein
MDIINERQHFDCPDNTDDEEKYVLSVYKRRVADPMEGDDILASLGLAPITKTEFTKKPPKRTAKTVAPVEKVVEHPSSVVDDFTQFVRHTLALKIFGTNLPTEPPKAEDSPEMKADLMTLHFATVGSRRFLDCELQPNISALYELVHSKIPESNKLMKAFHEDMLNAPELQIHPGVSGISSWTLTPFVEKDEILKATVFLPTGKTTSVYLSRAEASLIEVLHNVYHLRGYICAAIVEAVKGEDVTKLTYVGLWKLLASEHFNDPIFTWQEFTFKPFVEYMVTLYRVWQFALNEIH